MGDMSNIINSGVLNIVFVTLLLAAPVLFLLVWFFVNRISVRANEQIELLEEILEQQKRQNLLLLRLCAANEPDEAQTADDSNFRIDEFTDDDPLIQLVAER